MPLNWCAFGLPYTVESVGGQAFTYIVIDSSLLYTQSGLMLMTSWSFHRHPTGWKDGEVARAILHQGTKLVFAINDTVNRVPQWHPVDTVINFLLPCKTHSLVRATRGVKLPAGSVVSSF